MVTFPSCKINLGLNVIGKRPDGYHNLVTGFYPVAWHDALEIVLSKNFIFTASGIPVPGPSVDNLCVRAFGMMQKEYRLKPVAIHLHKVIPIGAGLGGGSSDGAHTLLVLNDIFKLGLSSDKLKEYAARLGSDCAFFIENKAMVGTDRGEVLEPLDLSLKEKFIVIITPDVKISTKEAFSGITPRNPVHDLRRTLESRNIVEWKHLVKNDFEDHLFKQFPIIEALQQKLYALGAVYACMSGSGSSVFGIFDNAVNLKKEFESLGYWSGFLS
jgi:4-diphosphocytidyl-2-C-methyl-D-erythritol kinase